MCFFMRTLKLVLAYDGTGYKGFQKQAEGLTVQQELETFLSRVCGERIITVGSGRTDSGVHARYQVVSFTTEGRIAAESIVKAGRSLLPENIALLQAQEVPAGFNARKCACWKRYLYQIKYCQGRDPFTRNYYWQLDQKPEVRLLQAAAEHLLGRHDFSGYQSSGSAPVSPVKTIYEAKWQAEGDKLIFTISGDGFVYHMVRNLVWSMVQTGTGLWDEAAFARTLTLPRGGFENAPAPAQGLYLDFVSYRPYPEV